MNLLSVVVVFVVAVSLTCTEGLSSYRKRLYKRQALPVNSTAAAAQAPGCYIGTGIQVPFGRKYTELMPGSCRICRCRRIGLVCVDSYCMAPMCVDHVRPDCCYECPNGPNCRLPTGEIITAPVVRAGMRCECPSQDHDLPGIPSPEHTTAICT